MTYAVSAQDDALYVRISDVWTKLGECKASPDIGETAEKIDATNYDSEMKEYIKDIPDQGDLEFTFNAQPIDAPSSNVKTLMEMSRNSEYEWKYVMPRLGVQVVWRAEFAYRVAAGSVSNVRELVLTLIPKSRPIETPITSTYTVTYDANGGSGEITDMSSPYDNGTTVTVQTNTFEAPASGKKFAYFNTKADNSGNTYDEGDTFQIYEDTTLYAIWSD